MPYNSSDGSISYHFIFARYWADMWLNEIQDTGYQIQQEWMKAGAYDGVACQKIGVNKEEWKYEKCGRKHVNFDNGWKRIL